MIQNTNTTIYIDNPGQALVVQQVKAQTIMIPNMIRLL